MCKSILFWKSLRQSLSKHIQLSNVIYFLVITWARVVCLICTPNARGQWVDISGRPQVPMLQMLCATHLANRWKALTFQQLFLYRTRGFIHDTLFSRISRKLLDSWKFNSWTATSQVKCIISYWNKEGSSWKFKRELSACNWFVKISHREKYPAYGIRWMLKIDCGVI